LRVKDIKKDKVGLWDPADMGEVVLDDTFDLSPKEAQLNVLKFCKDLRE